jgi:hypothetical protein
VHAQLCLQGSGAAACLLCMLGAVIIFFMHKTPGRHFQLGNALVTL